MDWGSIASVGGSVVNGMLGYIANERTNEQNADLTRENWKWQKDMYQLQLSDQERLYNKYNSPEAMRKQYELAGLNPYMMMKNGAQGQANINSSVPSSSPIPMHSYQPNIDLSPLAQYGLTDAQRDSLQASTDAQLIKNRFAILRERFELEEKLANSKLTDTQRQHLNRQIKMLDIEARYQEDFLKARNDSQKQDAALKRSEAALNVGKIEYQNYMNKAFPAISDAQMRVMNAQVYNLIQSGLAAGASIEQIKANCAKLMADKLNVEQDTENKKQQNNINKPNEILSGKESKDLNNDPKENDIYHGLDMLFKYVLPIKRMFK